MPHGNHPMLIVVPSISTKDGGSNNMYRVQWGSPLMGVTITRPKGRRHVEEEENKIPLFFVTLLVACRFKP